MNLCKNQCGLIGCGLFATALLVEAVLLIGAGSRLSNERNGLQSRRHRLERLLNSSPFPSEENVKRLRRPLEMLEYRKAGLVNALNRTPFSLDTIEAADFSARAQEAIERIRKHSEQSSVELPDAFEAGFSRYASGGAVPDVRYVPRLYRQLYSVERVADVLVRSGVDSIDILQRDRFETESIADAERLHQLNPDESAAVKADREASFIDPGGLYYIESIRVVFTAKKEAVWRVLDMFLIEDHCMVISEFSHITNADILRYNPEAAKSYLMSKDALRHYLSGGILEGEYAQSRSERIIAGNETIRVSLAVDIYNFNQKIK